MEIKIVDYSLDSALSTATAAAPPVSDSKHGKGYVGSTESAEGVCTAIWGSTGSC